MADPNCYDYTCAMCGGTFHSERSDAEALAECTSYFGDMPREELAEVCETCWEKVHPARHPELVAAYRKKPMDS